jgi:hypothetical protein
MLSDLLLKIVENVHFDAFSDVIPMGAIDRKTYYLHNKYVNVDFGERDIEGYCQEMD